MEKDKDIYGFLSLLSFALAFVFIIHHFIIHGYFFDIHDFISHEVIEVGLIGGGIAFLIAYLLKEE